MSKWLFILTLRLSLWCGLCFLFLLSKGVIVLFLVLLMHSLCCLLLFLVLVHVHFMLCLVLMFLVFTLRWNNGALVVVDSRMRLVSSVSHGSGRFIHRLWKTHSRAVNKTRMSSVLQVLCHKLCCVLLYQVLCLLFYLVLLLHFVNSSFWSCTYKVIINNWTHHSSLL